MRFKRRKRNYNQKKKDGFHPKKAISGAILLAIAITIIYFETRSGFNFSYVSLGVSMGMGIAGTLLLLFSPSRRGQQKISRGMDVIGSAVAKSMEGCKCCRCTNCGRDHNHWTHKSDPDDFWD